MASQEINMSAFLGQFRDEAREIVQTVTEGILRLETSPGDPETMQEMARALHTLKGSARMLGLGRINRLAHGLEDMVARVQTGNVPMAGEAADVTLAALDLILEAAQAACDSGSDDVDVEDICDRIGRVAADSSPRSVQDGAPAEATPSGSGEPPADASATPSAPDRPGPDGEPGAGDEEDGAGAAQTEDDAAGFEVLEKRLPPLKGRKTAGPAPAAKAARPDTVSPPRSRAAPPAAAAPESRAGARSHARMETVRVDTGKLDRVAAIAGEMVSGLARFEALTAEARSSAVAARGQLEAWQRLFARLPGQHGAGPEGRRADAGTAVLADLAGSGAAAAENLTAMLRGLSKRLAGDTLQLAMAVRMLQEDVMSVRMEPVSALFSTFPRAVRDMARELGKQVDLVIEGGETEFDRQILQAIREPLLHLVRNALSHGIEAAAQRVADGKGPKGTVRLAARRHGDQVLIIVSDDGKGIDAREVREAALAAGLVDPATAPRLTTEDCLALLFEPGFSTSSEVSDISGRGIGMDVVRTCVDGLSGQVRIDSVVGEGTTVTLALPLTLATTRVLLVRDNERVLAIPTMSVESATKVPRSDVRSVEGRDVIIVRDATVPVLSLSGTLGLAPAGRLSGREDLNVIVVSYAQQNFGLAVDETIGEQEVVLRPLGAPMRRVRNVAGAAILSTGELVLVLNVPDMVATARALLLRRSVRDRAGAGAAARRKKVLVVEDSPTAREIERSMMEAAGYEVETARDGAEGLNRLAAAKVDLIITDIQMPRMDGLEMTRRLKADSRYRDIPVIIVTSKAGESERRQGLAAGADAYFEKPTLGQEELQECVRRLVE